MGTWTLGAGVWGCRALGMKNFAFGRFGFQHEGIGFQGFDGRKLSALWGFLAFAFRILLLWLSIGDPTSQTQS